MCVPWLIQICCAMTHSYVCRDSLPEHDIIKILQIHVCAMTHSCMCHDSLPETWHHKNPADPSPRLRPAIWGTGTRTPAFVTWLIHMRDMTHSFAWHDSFIRVTWLIYTRDMTHLYAWHDSFICVTWLIRIRDMARFWGDRTRTAVFQTWLIHICDMTHSYVWNVSFVSVIWLVHNCENDSFICVTWLIS